MHQFENGFSIAPSILAALGLLIFILAQIFSIYLRVFLSAAGLLLIGCFFLKVSDVQNHLETIVADPANKDIFFSWQELYSIGAIINVISLIFWLSGMLRIAFSNIVQSDKIIAIICSAVIIGASFTIFKMFGQWSLFICFPILALGYFAAAEKFYLKQRA